MDGVRGCRETGRHRIRLLMAISLCTTPSIPPANKAVHLRVREATDESGVVIRQVPPLSSLHRGASFEFYLHTVRSTLSGFSAPATPYRILWLIRTSLQKGIFQSHDGPVVMLSWPRQLPTSYRPRNYMEQPSIKCLHGPLTACEIELSCAYRPPTGSRN